MISPLPNRIQGYQDMELLCQTESSYIYVTQRDGAPLGKQIALKFIPLNDHAQKSQIDNECQLQSTIGHSYIMPVNTYFDYKDGNQIYRVIEMPLGVDNLCNAYSKHFLGGIQHIYKLISELTACVNYLHQNKILHGGICPENIILKNANEEFLIPQLSGFRFAKLLSIYSPDDFYCNCRNRIPYFSAPELLESKSHSFPSDIWSLGATFYFVITGNIIQDPKNLNLAYDSQFGPKFPHSGKELISRMLSFDPKDRPSASDIFNSDFFSEVMTQGLDHIIIQNKLNEYSFMTTKKKFY
ncbi:hypothetical protein M9Y10_037916 [Tritrichomonas musculus]|uniref:Protein kinase domain-containing protein n=1 Tax=Tritrichomonas musculus TaxID=1915356 RepID=A0ABR2K6Z1_9EUKA